MLIIIELLIFQYKVAAIFSEMRKKQRIQERDQKLRIKQLKPVKSKNKEMFAELKTHEQNKISKVNRSLPSANNNCSEMVNEDDQISYDQNMQANIQKNNQDMEQICNIVHNLISKNKISAKNAFDVPFIDLEKLQDFEKISDSDNGWKKISSTLQNDSKIYSYRVDAIHSIAYKIMNTMTRNQDQQPINQVQSAQTQMKKQNSLENIVFPILQQFDIDVGIQLQKNIQNINMQSTDKVSEFNPTYQVTRRRFDQNGLRGMLLNNIKLDSNLQLSLNESRQLKSGGFFQKSMNVQVSRLTEQPTIFKDVQNTRKAISEVTKQIFIPATGYEISWRKIKNGQLYAEHVETQNRDNEMDIEYDSQRPDSNNNFRRVQDVIKLKKQKKSLKNARDVAQDGMSWLSQKDLQMLGIKKTNIQPTENTLKKNSTIPEDGIIFDKKVVLKEEVFTEQTTEKQKMEYNQEIQQKHLLPIKLFHKFKVEQIMTLRQQPPQNLQQNMINPEEQMQKQKQFQQIDIKRQQISIKQSKQKLKSMVLKQTDFKTLCKKFQIAERNVAPELCFLTILHLANENNLRLEQINDSNFMIKS